MFGWIGRVRGWLSSGAGPSPVGATAAAAPDEVKAPRSASLATYLVGGVGGASGPQWNDWDTVAFNRSWVFAGTRAIGQRIAGQGIRVGTRGKPRSPGRPTGVKAAAAGPPWLTAGTVAEDDRHDLSEVLADPNPWLNAFNLVDLTVRSLILTGVGFWWVDDQPDGSTVVWYLPSGWVREDPEADVPLSRFLVTPPHAAEQFALSADELIRFASPDVSNPLRPMGVLRAGLATAVLDRQVEEAQTSAMQRTARPGLLVRVNQAAEAGGLPGARPVLTVAQRKALGARIAAAYAGAAMTGESLILDGFIESVEQLVTGDAEIDFRASGDMVRDKILELLGVNGIVLGRVEGVNRASSAVADEHFCFSTCRPICVNIGQTLTKWMRRRYEDADLVVWIPPPEPRDPDGHRADNDQLIRGSAVTVNELRQRHGLDPLPGPEGDQLVKAAPAPAAAPPGEPPPRPEKGSGGLWNLLTDAERREVFRRSRGGMNGHKPVARE